MIFVALAESLQAQRGSRRKYQVDWCRSFDEAWVEASERGCPVVVFFIQDGEPENEAFVVETLRGQAFTVLSEKTVCLIASRGEPKAHRELKVRVGDVERTVCKKFGVVSCLEHQRIEKEAFLEFFDGFIDTPHTLVCSPDRKVIDRFDDHVPPADVVGLVNRTLRNMGSSLTRSEFQKIRADLDEARKMVKDKRYGQSWKMLEGLVTKKLSQTLMEKVRQTLEEIRTEGSELLKDAEVKIRLEKFGEGVEILDQAITIFSGTDVERSAKKRLKEIKKDPRAKSAIKTFEKEKKARVLITEAEKLLRRRNFVKATGSYYRVLEFFADTKSATAAKAELEKLENDPRAATTVKKYKEGQAQKRFARGERYLTSGNKSLALKSFRQTVALFPGTPAAEKAKKKIDELE